jgi:NAD(P)-dependent dehydrogenase (short-subunit alcohol dehydrogenase family)
VAIVGQKSGVKWRRRLARWPQWRDVTLQVESAVKLQEARRRESWSGLPCPQTLVLLNSTMRKLEQPLAIVTGGASGIGRALCHKLVAAGVFPVVADINLPGAQAVSAAIRQGGADSEAAGLDVSREAEVQQLVDGVVARHGRVDYMFNNAAVAIVGEFRDGNIPDFRRIVDTNLFGVVHGTMAAYRAMLRQGSGHIVNVSSMCGLMPTPILTAYSTTKWAIVGFSTAVRAEARDLGVKVSVACPGLVRTDIHERNVYWNVRKEDHLAQLPLRWAIDPDQAAKGILRGVARNQQIIVFPWSVRLGWWVYRACPRIFSCLMARMLKRFRAIRIEE